MSNLPPRGRTRTWADVLTSEQEWHERAVNAEAELAVLNRVCDDYQHMIAMQRDQVDERNAAIRRVREICERDSFVADFDGQHPTVVEVEDILRALDGDRR